MLYAGEGKLPLDCLNLSPFLAKRRGCDPHLRHQRQSGQVWDVFSAWEKVRNSAGPALPLRFLVMEA